VREALAERAVLGRWVKTAPELRTAVGRVARAELGQAAAAKVEQADAVAVAAV